MTEPPPLQQVDRTFVRHRNHKLLYFGGCDYFRLASNPHVLQAAASGLSRYGLNVAASRLTTGNHLLYGQLERALANFFQAETATLAASGYVPSLMVAQALSGRFSHALIDDHAHGCLVDAAQLLDCPVLKFKHCDAADLARLIHRLGRFKPLLLTEGMFPNDGRIAPLKDYLAVLPPDAMILLDDAHAAGVLGKSGRGSPEYAGIPTKRIIQTLTLSKAFGVYGGAVLGSRGLRAAILARSRVFVGNTPLPLPLAFAAIKSIAILKSGSARRVRLARNTAHVRNKLAAAGLATTASPGPIIAIVPKNARESARLKRRLLANGIYPPFIKYPGGPASGYFRFAISSEHTQTQLNGLISAVLD